MNIYLEMLRKITLSPHYHSMLRFAAPLQDHFGINHFWYYKITSSGYYTYLGSHAAWNEHCFSESLLNRFPCIRHPSILQSGISLMKANMEPNYQNLLKLAWEKYQINFNINLIKNQKDGIEAFGFATRYNDPQADERLFNELPLLTFFIKRLREENLKLFNLMDENPIDLNVHLGIDFFELPSGVRIPKKMEKLLHHLGLSHVFLLTPRELDLLEYIALGYPAAYIAHKLKLSTRTVENYIETIKSKLDCGSKLELILKAQEIAATGYKNSSRF